MIADPAPLSAFAVVETKMPIIQADRIFKTQDAAFTTARVLAWKEDCSYRVVPVTVQPGSFF